MYKKNIDTFRKEIDKIDKKIIKLFEQRMNVVGEIVQYKINNNLQVLDSSRENMVIEKNSKLIKDEKYLPFYQEFIKNLMEVSKAYQVEIINKNENDN